MADLLKVTLLCTSDVHGFYVPWDYAKDEKVSLGGLSRISTIVKKIREENPNTILIDNGDLIQGNSAEFFLKDQKFPGIETINKMNYEIYNMGNHEFNFGMDKLINVVGQFKGISMMGNLYRKKNKIRFMNGIYYKIFDGIKIGFVSLNTPLVRRFEAKRGNLKYYDVMDADFELEKLLEEVGEVDALIGLFHMGDYNENDIPNTGVSDLLNNVKGADRIDAVFGGHMHQFLNIKINDTYFIEPGAFGRGLGRIDLYFDKSNKKKLIKLEPSIIKIDDKIESDKEIEDIISVYHNKLRNYTNETVGYLMKPLFNEDEIKGIPQTRVSQTKISDFFLDVMRYYSKADVVAVHFDNYWPDIKNKEVKRKDIFNAYRYSGGEITVFAITGLDLKKYMEWSAGFFNKAEVGDVNISYNFNRAKSKYSTFDIFGNIKYDIDLRFDEGNRIKNLRYMDNTPILDEDNIKIGLNKYRMDMLTSDIGPLTGKKFEILWSSLDAEELGVKGNIRNLAIKYFSELENFMYKSSDIKRWRIITYQDNIKKINKAKELINNGYLSLYRDINGLVDLTKSVNIYRELEDYQIERLKELYDIKAKKLIDIL